MPTEPRSKALIVAAARRYVGARFRHQGRDLANGIDCVGLLFVLAWDLGILPRGEDLTGYGRQPSPDVLVGYLSRHCDRRRDGAREPGDIAVMRWEALPQHVGVITALPDGREGLIHAYAGAKKCLEHGLSPEWRDRIVGDVYAVKGFA